MTLIDVNNIQIYYRLDGPEQGPVIMFSNSLASDLMYLGSADTKTNYSRLPNTTL